jgi:hypothetical protein
VTFYLFILAELGFEAGAPSLQVTFNTTKVDEVAMSTKS